MLMKEAYWQTIRKFRNKAVRLTEIKELVDGAKLDKNEKEIIEYLVRKNLAVRIVEDIYYIKDPLDYEPPCWIMLAKGLNKAGVKWYYGLLSAWMNGRVVQQVFMGEIIINDRYSGKRKCGGRKHGMNVYYIKTKRKELYRFGLEKIREGVWVSDPEKTLLDAIYFASYGDVPTMMMMEMMESYFDPDNSVLYFRGGPNFDRLKEYLRYYPDFVRSDLYGLIKALNIYYWDEEIAKAFGIEGAIEV